MNVKADIYVSGVVQGVGFRPFVYRTAKSLALTGYVLNLGDAGVKIVVEGQKEQVKKLILAIKNNPPPIAWIENIEVKWSTVLENFSKFVIKKSNSKRLSDAGPLIPPDIAICDECVNDIFEKTSRWYLYPFTSCAACGPRYSTIIDLPYDRPNTTMVDFPLCYNCNKGYTNPLDRRYHAQTTACPQCGPQYRLLDKKGHKIETSMPIKEAAHLINEGIILAIQGIAGTHLVTKTSDPDPIRELRRRKGRASRPFAIMVRDKDTIKKFTKLTEKEIKLLLSWRRPIVLAQVLLDASDIIPKESIMEIAPGLDTIGVMLPYSALHYLLFHYTDENAFIATSGNPSGIPMYIRPLVILKELQGIADYFLVHNRRIAQRVDDSVIKFIGNSPVFLRRSRGYVPEPIDINGVRHDIGIIAVGPEEKATGAILKSKRAYLTQHIGDTNRIENISFLQNALRHLIHLTGLKQIHAIGCDLHPEFLSTELAQEFGRQYDAELIRTQHHHAHLVSLIAEHGIDVNTNITCITVDGYGFGADGTAWGGEILVGNAVDFKRIGGLEAHYLPGGDLAARYPVRAFIGILEPDYFGDYAFQFCQNAPLGPNIWANTNAIELIRSSIRKRVNTIISSSAGRLLDAIAFALGVCEENSYNGECPMRLEAISRKTELKLHPEIRDNKLDTGAYLNEIIELRKQKIPIPEIAYAAQWYLGAALAQIACETANRYNTKHIGLTGGVALNRYIVQAVIEHINSAGFNPLIHKFVPPGDGGISLGQAVVAAQKTTI